MIILDFGSANTHKNDITYLKRMIDELVAVDTRKHEVVIKHQLFKDAPPNIPLHWRVFDFAYWYAEQQGYQTTSSVNDIESLRYLLRYDVPFVKIANKPELYWLAGEVPRKVPVYISGGPDMYANFEWDCWGDIPLACVSEYPSTPEMYNEKFGAMLSRGRISDHTTDFQLWYQHQPVTYEVHYKLSDSTGPDAGPFSRTASQLSEIL